VPEPSPLFSLRLTGVANRRLELVLSLAIVVAVLVSRAIAVPASIWNQDEAYFACAAVSFDPAANHPHPPWFPLWVATGKAMRALGAEPARGLQIVSAICGAWLLFPLVALWRRLLPPHQALVAALVALAAPGVWMLAGRAYSDTPAAFLLVLSLALLFRSPPNGATLAGASVASGLAVLVRPPLGLVAVASLLMACRREGWRRRAILLGPAAALVVAGALGILLSADPAVLAASLRLHSAWQLADIRAASRALGASGLARALGWPWLVWPYLAACALGAHRLLRGRRGGPAAPVLLGAVLPLALTVFALSDPGVTRYAIPFVALTTGLAVAGAAALHRLGPPVAFGVLVVSWAALVLPELPAYRREPAPALRALDDALSEARRLGGIVVADFDLVPFVDYRAGAGPLGVPLVYDRFLSHGPPPPSVTVAVYRRTHADLVAEAESRREFTCSLPLLRSLEPSEQYVMDVAIGALVRPAIAVDRR
jgi:hypothetical protein